MENQTKTALVTGGSRGIGRAVALKLAEAGNNVAIVYAGNREAAEETLGQIKSHGVLGVAIQCDVADFNAAKAAVDAVVQTLGGVDMLINNAGITKDGLLARMSEEQFDAVVDVSLKGSFNFIRHVTPLMMKKRTADGKKGWGRIVNLASIAGLMGNAGQVNYAAAKAGMIGLTKSVARELAGRNITCNAIAPGFIETDMTANLGDLPLIDAVPMKRMGKAEEVAELALFLCSDHAAYITGETIRIDGGLAM